jgi:hypothetical protein
MGSLVAPPDYPATIGSMIGYWAFNKAQSRWRCAKAPLFIRFGSASLLTLCMLY